MVPEAERERMEVLIVIRWVGMDQEVVQEVLFRLLPVLLMEMEL